EEDRQIEQAFRQVTGSKHQTYTPKPEDLYAKTDPEAADPFLNMSTDAAQTSAAGPLSGASDPFSGSQSADPYSGTGALSPDPFAENPTEDPFFGSRTADPFADSHPFSGSDNPYAGARKPSQEPYPGAKKQSPDPYGAYRKPGNRSSELFRNAEEPLFDEPQEEENDGSFLDTVLDFYSKNKKLVLIGLCAFALVLIVGITAIFFFSASGGSDGKILNNVYIAGINVGGMTKNEAISAVNKAVNYATQDMVVDLSGTELRLSASKVGAKLDVKAAVSAAYDYGRTGTKAEQEKAQQATGDHIIGLLPYLELNEDYILETLESYAGDSGSTLTQANYGLEGKQPELAADKFDENAPCQTLVITMGTPGVGFDVDDVYNRILDAYSLHMFLVTVENVESTAEPDPVDLEAIYEEFYIAPVDATVDLRTYKIIPGSYGYGFDLEAAQKLVDQADYGEEVRIPMEYIEPELLDDDSFFQDVLGQCQTLHTSSESRTTNLKLACQALNGVVLNPGESFSFNDTVGQRTTAKGYKTVSDYVGDELMDVTGGGVSQVSSTLYCAALLADLDVTARISHSFPVGYIDYGLDAAIGWGSPDLKFTNSTSFPVKIEAEVSGGYVKIKILGTEQRSYYIKMESTVTNTYQPQTEYEYFEYDNAEGYRDGDVIQQGVTGYYVKTYKVKYDSQTNALISRDFVANTQYKTVNKIIAQVAPEETEPPTTEAPQPTDPPVPTETDPPETKPTEPVPTESKPAETESTVETLPPENPESPAAEAA
ncbi:MAG: VanW family protein, partial [Faecousia sp.]